MSDNASTRPFSVFVSYARKDDVGGWVTSIVDALRKEAQFDGPRGSLRVFFDVSDIHSPEEWQEKLRWALQEAPVMLVCVSEPYFKSVLCLWEFLEHEAKAVRPDVPSDIVPVFLEEAPEFDDEEHRHWRARVYAMQAKLDLRGIFARETIEVCPEELAAQVRVLASDLAERERELRRWEAIDTNIGQGTSRFVGRHTELTRLGEALFGAGSIGLVTAVAGLGGIGKTELVRYYAHSRKGYFQAGTWMLPAEGASRMLPLLARLAHELPGFALPDEVRNDPEEAGRCVRRELLRRTSGGDDLLLVLDNVDQLELLSDRETAELPNSRRIHVAATTRLGTGDFAAATRLSHVPIGGLSARESVELLRAYQPDRDGNGTPDFASPDDEAAAWELAELLDGFTLAIEQAAVHLNTQPDLSVREYLEFLRRDGALMGDEMLTEQDKASLQHSTPYLRVILDATLTSLEESLPGALQALRYAAAMPPDVIPWPWLEELMREHHPEVFEPSPRYLKGRWASIRRALEGRALITEGKYPTITGRMHRLIAEYLRDDAAADAVHDHVIRRADELSPPYTTAPDLWEVDCLVDALPRPLRQRPTLIGAIPDFLAFTAPEYLIDDRTTQLLTGILTQLAADQHPARAIAMTVLAANLHDTDPGQALTLYQESLTITRTLAKQQPNNLSVQRDLSVSLINVADLLQHTDPGQALTHYEEALTTHRALAAQQPNNLQTQRDLTISLNNVARLQEHTNPQQVLTLYQESLTITRALATQQPNNLSAQRDLTAEPSPVLCRFYAGSSTGWAGVSRSA